jgi:hypothetical protein
VTHTGRAGDGIQLMTGILVSLVVLSGHPRIRPASARRATAVLAQVSCLLSGYIFSDAGRAEASLPNQQQER